MSRLLMLKSPVLTNPRTNKSKRVLQVLQVSASDKDLLVSPNLMSGKEKHAALQKKTEVSEVGLSSKENSPVVQAIKKSKRKNVVTVEQVKKSTFKEGTEVKESSNKHASLQKKTKVSKVGPASEENTPAVRPIKRSKRKNAVSQEQVKTSTSKELTEAKDISKKVSKVAKPKKTSTRKNKKQSSTDSKQSKLDSFIATSSISNTIFESNLEIEASSVEDVQSQQSKISLEAAVDTTIALATDESLPDSQRLKNAITTNMFTSDDPPESYWKMLAEERSYALDLTSRENEQLYDQIHVLETENSQLKSCLKEAENLAVVIRQSLN